MIFDQQRLVRSPESLVDLVNYVGFQRINQDSCDVIIHGQDGQVVAHRLVLGTRSRLVRNVHLEEEVEILAPDFSATVLRQLLELIYTGTVNISQDESNLVIELLTLLDVEHTYEKCTLASSKKQKLKIKHENNLSSRKAVPEQKSNRKKRIFSANLDPADLTCNVCLKVFPKLYKLKNHQLIHLKSFPFICSDCGKGFKNKYKLNSHEKDHKKGALPPERKKKTVTKPRKEEGQKVVECNHCGEGFLRQGERNNHVLQVHKVTVNHSCFHCSTKFRTKRNLIAHLRVVHNDLEGVLRHVCPICDKRFLKPSHLEDHQARHDPIGQHPCMYCPKRCATKQDLDRHLCSHRGEARLTCQLCFQSFVHRSTYTEHVRKHLGQKPYICKPCNKNFSHYKTLSHHQKTHEKKGDKTIIVLPNKGSRGCHSYIDLVAEPALDNPAELKQKDLSTQVYIPGPQYNKSTRFKANQQTLTPLKQQVIADYTEISRIGFQFSDADNDGFPSMVEMDQIFQTQPINIVSETILPDHDLS